MRDTITGGYSCEACHTSDDIVKTKQRPDIVLFSRGSKRIIFIELTIPWEKAVEKAYERNIV